MEIITKIKEMQKKSQSLREKKKEIGFVPTMGALHKGHMSLIEKSKKENNITIVSIFINPLQFDDQEDLKDYPRVLEKDLKICEKLSVDIVFIPSKEEMYPKPQLTFVRVERLSDNLCGLFRKGHFQGVATVVTKLFNITKPHRAYFGAKDFQQAQIIKKLVEDLNFEVEILVLPTIRDKDGLALSSRHKYLTAKEKEKAKLLYHALMKGVSLLEKDIKDSKIIIEEMEKVLKKEPLIKIEYLKVCDPNFLTDLKEVSNTALLALAVKIGKARLIDNILWRNR
jgi:pantoate--beta-alanine ligase